MLHSTCSLYQKILKEGLLMKLTHLLSMLPCLGIFGGLPWANRTTPYVLGMPFILFWIVMWVVLTSVIMAIVFKLDPANKESDS
jgi:hypothetical protein